MARLYAWMLAVLCSINIQMCQGWAPAVHSFIAEGSSAQAFRLRGAQHQGVTMVVTMKRGRPTSHRFSMGPHKRGVSPESPQQIPALEGAGVARLDESTASRILLFEVPRQWMAVVAAPAIITGYLSAMRSFALSSGVDSTCIDPMNLVLLRFWFPWFGEVPCCLWNLTHVAMFAFLASILPKQDIGLNHMLALFAGVVWFLIEPSLFSAVVSEGTVLQSHSCGDMNIAYDSTWRPRNDDFIFNTAGQVLYETSRRMRARVVWPPALQQVKHVSSK